MTKQPSAPDRDLFQLAYELMLPPGHPKVDAVVNEESVSYEPGRVDQFFLVDLETEEKYQSSFELRHVSPRAYWYVEEGMRVDQGDIERAAVEFEEVIYPGVTEYFGTEWTPGVDNDPHLTIVHGDIRGAAGYFSSTDEYPSAIRPHSNQREMIYINSRYLAVGSDIYYHVLAHELNHAVMWNHDRSEDTWVSEGFAELSVTLAGYRGDGIRHFLRRPFVSLVHWPLDSSSIGAHYGGASLFMHYLHEHYSGPDRSGMRILMAESGDNVAGIDSYLEQAGYDMDFHEVFRDWIAANFLDEEGGVHGYSDLEVEVQASRRLSRPGKVDREGNQYGTHYIELGGSLKDGPARIEFEGQGLTPLLPVDVPEEGCWWSNSGDSITSTLTREVDLTALTSATLTFDGWHHIEKDWDYVYLEVSTDGSDHWEILEGEHSSTANPIGVAFGPGYTSRVKDWISEEVDLSPYAGKVIQVRFQYVTDDALNDIGMCLKDLAITDAGVLPMDGGWKADGFVLVRNIVEQEFMVQIIQKGETNRVYQVPLERNAAGDWRGEYMVEPYPGLERTMLAITPTAPATREKAGYVLTVDRAEP
ncbi:MAG: immune inhibitor A [Chloroflexota bacterium]|nr:immune inhibitor A [Chloroflexota bacterium]